MNTNNPQGFRPQVYGPRPVPPQGHHTWFGDLSVWAKMWLFVLPISLLIVGFAAWVRFTPAPGDTPNEDCHWNYEHVYQKAGGESEAQYCAQYEKNLDDLANWQRWHDNQERKYGKH